MDNFESHPYEYSNRLFRLIGLNFNKDKHIQLGRTCFIGFIFALAIIIQLSLFATSEMEIQKITDLMQTFIPTICFTACYINSLYNVKIGLAIHNNIKKHLSTLSNQEEVNVIKKYAKQTKVYSIIITCMFYFYLGFLFLPSLWNLHVVTLNKNNNTELVLPVRVEYCQQNRTRYFSMLFLQWIGISIICTVGIAYYAMVITCVQHACALFALVSVKVDFFLKKKSLNRLNELSVAEIHEETNWIVSVIECYNEAINFVDLLISISTKTYCIEILLALAFFVIDFIYLFQLHDMTLSRNETARNCMYIIGSVVVIYCAFYIGQKLIDHSFNVYHKFCQIPFYVLSIRTQKLLMLLITRSLKPCSININGMMVTSHEVFAKMANTSYTFAILCYKMR